MKNPKVMVVQMNIVVNNIEVNIEKIKDYCGLASRHSCDFIVFPEYCMGIDTPIDYDKNEHMFFINKIKEYAKRFNIYIIAGSVLTKQGDKCYNSSFLISRDGKCIGKHDKIALVKYVEKQKLHPGDKTEVFDTEFGKIAIAICRDMLYPDIIQSLSNKGAKIIFIPAWWSYDSTHYQEADCNLHNDYPVTAEFTALKTLPPARAIENEAFIIVANAAGVSSWKEAGKQYIERLAGHSSVNAPLHGCLVSLNHTNEGYLISELDLSILKDSEQTYSVKREAPNHDYS